MNQLTGPLANFHHVGAIVKDCDKTAAYYESLGMGVFEPLMVTADELRIGGKLVNDLMLKIRIVHTGPTRLELIEPVAGKDSIWQKVLDTKGECLHHMAFVVDDLEKAKAELIKKGLKLLFNSHHTTGGGAAYFETGKIGDLVIEIFQRPDDYVKK
jgi:methylmalonyl-CoA/ethylmalonyl-CoA epimerase